MVRRVVLGGDVPLVGPQDERARGKRRGFRSGDAARNSHSARVHTDSYSWSIHIFPDFFQVEPALLRLNLICAQIGRQD